MGAKRELQERIELANQEDGRPDGANTDLAWALGELKKRRGSTTYYRGYYSGDHRQMIRLERLRNIFGQLFQNFRINLCSSVVDAVADRLQIAGFTSPEEEAAREEKKRAEEEMASARGERRRRQAPLAEAEEVEEESSDPDEDGERGRLSELDAMLEKTVAQDASDIWERNRMRRRSGHVHQEAIASGDAYVLVWPDPEDEPAFYPQSAHEVCVSYDKEHTGKIVKAAKMWREDVPTMNVTGNGLAQRVAPGERRPGYRLNLYYYDRIEKYAALENKASEWPKVDAFKPFDQKGDGSWRVANEWGIVPIFHFANNADTGEYGSSELVDAVPVQDALNYKYFSLLVGVEFVSLPQRYLINVEDFTKNSDGSDRDPHNPEQFEGGADRLWAFQGLPRQSGQDEGEHPPQAGQFAPADLDKFKSVINLAAQNMAIVTGTPVHHFLPTTGGSSTPASGESQKTSDTKLQNKVVDREIAFGDTWAAAMALAVRMKRGLYSSASADAIKLDTNWKDTRPRNEKEQWDIAQLKIKAGMPWQFAFKELGYTDEQLKEFQRIKEENASAFGPPGFANGERTMGDVLDEIGVD